MSLGILKIGTHRPHAISQRQAAKLAQAISWGGGELSERLPALYRKTQIKERGSVLLTMKDRPDLLSDFFTPAAKAEDAGPTTGERVDRFAQTAGNLALSASRKALEGNQVPLSEITHLVTVSCTGFMAPGFDVSLIKGLNLSPTTTRTHVGFMGCHGALNGLRAARGYVDSDPQARVLLCSVELCSLHYQYGWDPEKVVANALFADGAGAVLGVPSDQATEQAWRLAASGACLFPDSEKAMTWRIGDHGFEMTLSAEVPDLILANLKPWLVDWLGSEGFGLSDIASWAVHPGGPRILESVEQSLGISQEQTVLSREVLASCGNMSSATILFILEQLQARRAPRPCVALGFGPGLAAEAALFV